MVNRKRRPRIIIRPASRDPVDRGSRTHVPCGRGALQQVRTIAARTGLSQKDIVTAVLSKTDLCAFVRLWTGDPLDTPTDIYRMLPDGTIVRTATVGGQAEGGLKPMSKYDDPWRTALNDAKFRGALLDALRKASGGNVSTIDVPPSIAALGGDRSGTVVVRSGSLIRPNSQLMVHAESLGEQVVDDGMLADWPQSVFRLSIDRTGKRLTVRLESP